MQNMLDMCDMFAADLDVRLIQRSLLLRG